MLKAIFRSGILLQSKTINSNKQDTHNSNHASRGWPVLSALPIRCARAFLVARFVPLPEYIACAASALGQ
jgi:hypothetical protein